MGPCFATDLKMHDNAWEGDSQSAARNRCRLNFSFGNLPAVRRRPANRGFSSGQVRLKQQGNGQFNIRLAHLIL